MGGIFKISIRDATITPNPPPATDAVTFNGPAAVDKIKKPARLRHSGGGEMPPTVSVEEMRKLKVIK